MLTFPSDIIYVQLKREDKLKLLPKSNAFQPDGDEGAWSYSAARRQ